MSTSPSGRKGPPATVYHLGLRHAGLTLPLFQRACSRHVVVDRQGLDRTATSPGQRQFVLGRARRVNEKDVVKLWQQPLPRPVDTRDLRDIAHRRAFDRHETGWSQPVWRHFAERKISTRRRQLQPTLEELLPPVLAKPNNYAGSPCSSQE
ncbi:MAG: hypothetical protein R3C56_40730 [Pirellulaceae bacterium]